MLFKCCHVQKRTEASSWGSPRQSSAYLLPKQLFPILSECRTLKLFPYILGFFSEYLFIDILLNCILVFHVTLSCLQKYISRSVASTHSLMKILSINVQDRALICLSLHADSEILVTNPYIIYISILRKAAFLRKMRPVADLFYLK